MTDTSTQMIFAGEPVVPALLPAKPPAPVPPPSVSAHGRPTRPVATRPRASSHGATLMAAIGHGGAAKPRPPMPWRALSKRPISLSCQWWSGSCAIASFLNGTTGIMFPPARWHNPSANLPAKVGAPWPKVPASFAALPGFLSSQSTPSGTWRARGKQPLAQTLGHYLTHTHRRQTPARHRCLGARP